MKNTTRIIKLLLIIIALTTSAVAYTGGMEVDLVSIGVGARALGMGSAFVGVADNADTVYWNPGGLGSIKFREITMMQTRLSSDADYYYLSYVMPLIGGTVGISWSEINAGLVAETSSEVDNYNEIVTLGDFVYLSDAISISYGREIRDNLMFGLGLRYMKAEMGEGRLSQGYSITPGLLAQPGKRLKVGCKLENYIGEVYGRELPSKASVGFSIDMERYGLISFDLDKILADKYTAEAKIGYEIGKDGLCFRVGIENGKITAGAGFTGEIQKGSGIVRIDYAYVQQTSLTRNNVHRISLSGRWE